MRFHNFWCISFVSREFLNHVQKTPKSWEMICSITIFDQDPEKNTFTGLGTPQNYLVSSHLFLRQSWTKVLGHFCISGRFSIHAGPTPSLTPQTMLDTCIQNFFRVSTFYRVGGGKTVRKFRKRCPVLRGNREVTEKYELQYCPKDFCPGL